MAAPAQPKKWLPLPEKDPCPPKRTQKDYGTLGKKIQLFTNHFPITWNNKDVTIYHYDIKILNTNKKELALPKVKNFGIFEEMKKSYPRVFGQIQFGFDRQKSAYSIGRLPLPDPPQFQVVYEDTRKSTFIVVLTEVNSASISELFNVLKASSNGLEFPQTIFQMLEILFRQNRTVKYMQVGQRSFFPDASVGFENPSVISSDKECVLGFFATLRPAGWKNGSLLLNLDVAHAAFYKEQTVFNFISANTRVKSFDREFVPADKKQIEKVLKGLKIYVTHTDIKRTYKVNGLAPKGAKNTKFTRDLDNGQKKEDTIENYFRTQYKKTCKYPFVNCLHVGNPTKNIFIPMEFCCIAKNQKVKNQLSPNDTKEFIKTTAIPPDQRLSRIKDIRTQAISQNDQILNALGFSISTTPLSTSGRVLPDPTLQMDKKVIPNYGVWDTRNNKFNSPAALDKWIVICYSKECRPNDVEHFLTELEKLAKAKGMVCEKPLELVPAFKFRDVDNPSAHFDKYKKKYPNINLILCILSNSPDLYGNIKLAGDIEHSIITQCVKWQNVRSAKTQTIDNLLLKINAKLKGINYIVEREILTNRLHLFNVPIMIMGADVNHPPASDAVTPSLVAVVASFDRDATKYHCEIRHQSHRTEVIMDMTEITKTLLKAFYAKNQRPPQRIIMYRDGVSESQFSQVLSVELKKMRDACTQIQKGYEPPITFICVQKRHHTRFFCDEKELNKFKPFKVKNKNVPPGTTVDRDITHPSERDFFLCSHQGIQGTSRPTHYHVLWDDSDLNMNQIQMMTYCLCHTYSRCPRSVSIPTPAYYAHLAAYRAKVHYASKFNVRENISMSSGSSGDQNKFQDVDIQAAIKVNAALVQGPYFI